MLETKLVTPESGIEYWKHGYFLSIDELKELCKWYAIDSHEGIPSETYIENYLKNHNL